MIRKKLYGHHFFGLALVSLAGAWMTAAAQVINITGGVQTYAGFTNTTVNMTGQCALYVTGTNNPVSGSTINLNSSDAWFFLPNLRPSVVAASYLSNVKVNGATAVADSNCRVVQYGSGTVVVPHAPSFQPLQVFTGANFTGSSSYLSQYTAYTDANLGAFNNSISSFRLKRGYMATFAQNANGTGISRNFIAADGDLDVTVMPAGLDDTISFVRVFPWRWAAKKGFGETGTSVVAGQNLDLSWNYSWDINQNSTRDREYVAIRQTRYWPDLSQNWQTRSVNTLLGYNEPDNAVQANLAVGDAIWSWPDLLGTGLRVGSPAVTDGGRSSWLYPFMEQADAANLRVDFVAIHYYQCHDPADPAGAATQMYNFLKATYDQTRRPIWVTEWNNGANWTGCGDPTYAQQQACISAMVDMLENTPFVERYAIYNWVEDVRRAAWDDGSLTSAGMTYRDKVSRIGYIQDGLPGAVRSVARFQFEGNVLDSSGAGNNGIAVGIPGYTTGTNGQAIQLDGTNSYVILPDNMAGSPAFTFAAWVKWDGGGNWQRIFDFGNDTSHYLFLTPSSGSGTLRFAINNGGGEQILQTGTALPVGQWRHVAVTISNNTARLYLNGAIVASSNSFSILPSQFDPIRNYLGKSQFSADPLFRGSLDEVVLAHYAMSPSEIAALSAGQAPVFLDIGNGIWTSDGSGNWSDTSRWSNYLPANGAGYTADFSFLDITADRTAILNSSRSIGSLVFGDASGAQNWTLASSGGSVLTLDSGSAAQPSVVVNQNTATISAPLAGSNGLVKSGPGTLALSGINPLSGQLNLDTGSTTTNDGAVCLASPGAGANLTSINIRNNNGGSSTLQLSGGAVVSAPVSLNGRNMNVAAIQNISGSNTLNGNLSINAGGGYYVLQSDAGTLKLGGVINSAASGTRNFTFQGTGDYYVSGSIQNGSAATVNVTKLDAGNLILANQNTFSGMMTVGGGSVIVNTPLALLANAVSVPCASLNAVRFGSLTTASIGNLSGIGDIWLTNSTFSPVTLTIGAGNASSEFAGAFKGPGGIFKAGSGTLTLSATNAYTGATTVAGGTLRFGTATNIIASLQPVLWMSFDQAGGGTVTNQGTGGWGMNGTLIGSGAYVTGGGRFGNALYVNGAGGVAATNIVKIASKVVDTSASGSWTVGYWIKTTTAGAVIMYQGDGGWSSSGQTTYLLNANSGSTAGTKAGAVRWAGGFLTGSTTLNDGNWHFITLVDSAGTESIYVDGNVEAKTSSMNLSLAAGANQTWIGGAPDADAGAVKITGYIDEVCIFDRALTLAQIRAIVTNAPMSGSLPSASAVNIASGATLDLSGISQSVASLADYNGGGGIVTNSTAAPVTLTVGINSAASSDFSGRIGDSSPAGPISLVKNGTSTQVLSGANNCRGTTTVNAGALLVNGVLGTNTVTVIDGTLGGNGRVGGNVLIQAAGTLSPGNSIGKLICSNNLGLAGTTLMEINRNLNTNDSVVVLGTLNYGGTLVVTNLSGTLDGGDHFKLFTAASFNSTFAGTNLPALNPGLAWNFNPTNGTLTVLQMVATNPTNLTWSVSGTNLTLSWPADHTGWRLQVQTNHLASGLSLDTNDWFSVSASQATNQITLPLDLTLPGGFYRLVYP